MNVPFMHAERDLFTACSFFPIFLFDFATLYIRVFVCVVCVCICTSPHSCTLSSYLFFPLPPPPTPFPILSFGYEYNLTIHTFSFSPDSHSKQLFYQLVWRDFSNFGTIRVAEPLPLRDLLHLALERYVDGIVLDRYVLMGGRLWVGI